MLEEFRGLKIKGLRRLRLPRAFWRLSRPPRRPPPHAPPPMDGQLETTPTPKSPQAPPLQKFLSKTLIKTCGFLHSRTMSSCSFTRHTRGQDVPGAARDPPQIMGLNGFFERHRSRQIMFASKSSGRSFRTHAKMPQTVSG